MIRHVDKFHGRGGVIWKSIVACLTSYWPKYKLIANFPSLILHSTQCKLKTSTSSPIHQGLSNYWEAFQKLPSWHSNQNAKKYYIIEVLCEYVACCLTDAKLAVRRSSSPLNLLDPSQPSKGKRPMWNIQLLQNNKPNHNLDASGKREKKTLSDRGKTGCGDSDCSDYSKLTDFQ